MILQSEAEDLKIFKGILFRSSFYATSAFFIVLLFEKLLSAAGAAFLGYHFSLSYEKLAVNAGHLQWSRDAVLIIYLIPEVIMLVIYLLHYVYFQGQQSEPRYSRIMTLWILFFITFRIFGLIPVHLYFREDIFHALDWLYLGMIPKILIGLAGFIIFMLSGVRILNGIFFVMGTYNRNYLEIGKKNLLFSAILLPALTGSVVSFLFLIPGLPPDQLSGIVISLLPAAYCTARIMLTKPAFLSSRIDVEDRFNPMTSLLIMFIAIILVRVILGFGISL
jgi:hypothetical protein